MGGFGHQGPPDWWFCVAGSLSAFVYQHAITPLALPCKLSIPTRGRCRGQESRPRCWAGRWGRSCSGEGAEPPQVSPQRGGLPWLEVEQGPARCDSRMRWW